MPKKTRKMKQRAALRRSAMAAPAAEERVEESANALAEPAMPLRPALSSARAVTPLTFDYTHIYGDLKRIALFASFFFAVLIVLSFIIK